MWAASDGPEVTTASTRQATPPKGRRPQTASSGLGGRGVASGGAAPMTMANLNGPPTPPGRESMREALDLAQVENRSLKAQNNALIKRDSLVSAANQRLEQKLAKATAQVGTLLDNRGDVSRAAVADIRKENEKQLVVSRLRERILELEGEVDKRDRALAALRRAASNTSAIELTAAKEEVEAELTRLRRHARASEQVLQAEVGDLRAQVNLLMAARRTAARDPARAPAADAAAAAAVAAGTARANPFASTSGVAAAVEQDAAAAAQREVVLLRARVAELEAEAGRREKEARRQRKEFQRNLAASAGELAAGAGAASAAAASHGKGGGGGGGGGGAPSTSASRFAVPSSVRSSFGDAGTGGDGGGAGSGLRKKKSGRKGSSALAGGLLRGVAEREEGAWAEGANASDDLLAAAGFNDSDDIDALVLGQPALARPRGAPYSSTAAWGSGGGGRAARKAFSSSAPGLDAPRAFSPKPAVPAQEGGRRRKAPRKPRPASPARSRSSDAASVASGASAGASGGGHGGGGSYDRATSADRLREKAAAASRAAAKADKAVARFAPAGGASGRGAEEAKMLAKQRSEANQMYERAKASALATMLGSERLDDLGRSQAAAAVPGRGPRETSPGSSLAAAAPVPSPGSTWRSGGGGGDDVDDGASGGWGSPGKENDPSGIAAGDEGFRRAAPPPQPQPKALPLSTAPAPALKAKAAPAVSTSAAAAPAAAPPPPAAAAAAATAAAAGEEEAPSEAYECFFRVTPTVADPALVVAQLRGLGLKRCVLDREFLVTGAPPPHGTTVEEPEHAAVAASDDRGMEVALLLRALVWDDEGSAPGSGYTRVHRAMNRATLTLPASQVTFGFVDKVDGAGLDWNALLGRPPAQQPLPQPKAPPRAEAPAPAAELPSQDSPVVGGYESEGFDEEDLVVVGEAGRHRSISPIAPYYATGGPDPLDYSAASPPGSGNAAASAAVAAAADVLAAAVADAEEKARREAEMEADAQAEAARRRAQVQAMVAEQVAREQAAAAAAAAAKTAAEEKARWEAEMEADAQAEAARRRAQVQAMAAEQVAREQAAAAAAASAAAAAAAAVEAQVSPVVSPVASPKAAAEAVSPTSSRASTKVSTQKYNEEFDVEGNYDDDDFDGEDDYTADDFTEEP